VGWGGSELMRKCHDSGGMALKNHQLIPPPVKGRIFFFWGGLIRILSRRSECAKINRSYPRASYHITQKVHIIHPT
jgi:hypothetical protein